MGKVISIQYLRALAAISVVVFHAGSQPLASGATVAPATAIGAAGVDVFFVISGLIMWMVTEAEGVRPSVFLAHRLLRIVPLYWAVTLGKTLLGIVLPRFGEHHLNSFGHLALSLLFIPHVSPENGKILPVLTPGWTLNYEMFFYVSFAAALGVPPRLRVVVLSLWLVGLVIAGWLFHPANPALSVYTDPLLLEFLFGVLLGALASSSAQIPPWVASVALIAGLAAFVLDAIYPLQLARELMWGVPAALLVCGCVLLEKQVPAPRFRPLLALGDGSYSIYLIHGFFVIALASVIRKKVALGVPEAAAIVLGAAVLASVSGVICYYIVEKPLARILRRRFSVWTNASGPEQRRATG